MLILTDSAIKEFKKLITDSNANGSGIRVFTSGKGCCGVSYGLDIAEKAEEGDTIIEKDGLKVFVEIKASVGLENATIDFITDGPRRGFTILGLQQSSCC